MIRTATIAMLLAANALCGEPGYVISDILTASSPTASRSKPERDDARFVMQPSLAAKQ